MIGLAQEDARKPIPRAVRVVRPRQRQLTNDSPTSSDCLEAPRSFFATLALVTRVLLDFDLVHPPFLPLRVLTGADRRASPPDTAQAVWAFDQLPSTATPTQESRRRSSTTPTPDC